MKKLGPGGYVDREVIMHFHSTNLERGCGRIFDTNNGAFFEYTLGAIEGDQHEVYGVHLSNDIARQFGHVLVVDGLTNLLRTLGVRRDVWLKKARGTLEHRAECVLDIAAVFGWAVIDDEPNTFSSSELAKRWYDEFKKEGPVTSAALGDLPVLSAELLIALQSVDQVQYWSLLSGNFPVIPPEALNDSRAGWWRQHGQDAVARIVSAIEQVCPHDFEFHIREGRWGFWKKGRLGHGSNNAQPGIT